MNLFMQILTIVAASLMSAMGAFRRCKLLLDWRAAMPGPLGAEALPGHGDASEGVSGETHGVSKNRSLGGTLATLKGYGVA